ncbi:hypothetical protein ACLOJK_000838 [Asimina triloba]
MKANSSLLIVFLCCAHLLFHAASSSLSTDPSAYPDASAAESCGPRDDLTVVRREEYDDGRIIDITHRYREDLPSWDSDGLGQFLWLPKSMKNGSLANNSEMKMPTHSGTHVDAPGHVFDEYFDAGFDVDTLDLAVLNGPALLVDVARDKNLTGKGLMWKRDFDTSYTGFTKDGAQWLVDNTDIKLVGVDYLSVAAWSDLIPAHLVFLKSREIILVEGLKLDNVKPGIYTLSAHYTVKLTKNTNEGCRNLVSERILCRALLKWGHRVGLGADSSGSILHPLRMEDWFGDVCVWILVQFLSTVSVCLVFSNMDGFQGGNSQFNHQTRSRGLESSSSKQESFF